MSLLSQEFISTFPDFPKHMGNLAKLVYYRTYSRWLPDEGRRETWKETCVRAVEYNCSLARTSVYEAQRLFTNMFNLKQFISGRSLWIGGSEASKKTKLANFNCSFVVIDSIKSLCDLFYLLMVGTGVGVRILPKDVSKLPKFRNNVILHSQYNPHSTKQRGREYTITEQEDDMFVIKIGDSKEGWVEALRAYLNFMVSDTNCNHLLIDYTEIRVKGSTLSSFGGTASGYESIMDMFTKIHHVIQDGKFSSKPEHGKLRPIHCLDICNLIGQNVVVGGVRRTAEIAIIDPHDDECIHAKDNIQPGMEHRYMSNNSIYQEEKPSREKIHELFNSIRTSGEPGIINVAEAKRRRKDFAGVNPCFSPDTEVLTKEYGYIRIVDIVDEDVTVWNGYDWSVVTPRVTGYDQPMYRIYLSNGNELECTDYHKFVLQGDERVEACDLTIGDKLEKWEFPVIEQQETMNSMYDDSDIDPYIHGFYAGDGVQNKPLIWLYGDKRKLAPIFEDNSCTITQGEDRDTVRLPKQFSKKLVPDVGDSVRHRLRYLAGLLDSDGCVNSEDGALAITSIDKDFLIRVSRLLNTLGCHATVSKMKDGGFKELPVNDGSDTKKEYFCQPCYRLIISAWYAKHLMQLGLRTHRLVLTADPNRNASRFITVIYIERIRNCPTVYCFTENKNHTGVFNGVMTGQCAEILLPPNAVCNLTTVNMVSFVNDDGTVDWDGLELAFTLSARAGYRMTCVDLELEGWNEAHHRDRLTGCSMTGWQDFIAKMSNSVLRRAGGKVGILKWLRSIVHEAGHTISDELKTPVPLLMTALKPEGSLSLVANGVSPGVHWQHSPYFIRRIRVNAHDPLALTAKELGWQIHPEVGQDMETATTIVIDFPVHSPATVTKADVPAVEQLKEYILFQEYYTDMNTSNTITVKPEEWDEVEDFVYNHWDSMLGVTFLELNSTYYPLMPYEECTKEEYEELKSKMKAFDPVLLNNLELSTRNMGKEFEILDDRSECVSGVCPIR